MQIAVIKLGHLVSFHCRIFESGCRRGDGPSDGMGVMLSSLLACSGGAAILACVYPNWAAGRTSLTQVQCIRKS